MALRRHVRISLALLFSALPLVVAGSAFAQQPPPKPKPAGSQAPPTTKTDMELDPDAKPAPPPEPPPLPPPAADQWGVGGKDEEGKFAPPSKKKAEDEQRAKDAEDDKKPVDLGPARSASLDIVAGFGTMRDITHNSGGPDNGRTAVTSGSFIFGFNWRFAEIWTVGLRFPFTRASVDIPPTGSLPTDHYNTFASGNLELLVRPSFQLTRHLRLPAQISVFMPTAQGDFFPDQAAADKKVPLAQGLMNQAASYSRGLEEMPLFASKRFGFRLGAGITWDNGPFHVAAGTKLDVMLKIGGGDAYPGYEITSPTLAWVTNGSFSYSFLDGKVEPGMRVWLAYATLPIHTMVTNFSGAQFALEPGVNGRFPIGADKSMAVKAGVGVILPVGGPVGGGNDSAIKGVRIGAGFEF
jgi:hypothetical protein